MSEETEIHIYTIYKTEPWLDVRMGVDFMADIRLALSANELPEFHVFINPLGDCVFQLLYTQQEGPWA